MEKSLIEKSSFDWYQKTTFLREDGCLSMWRERPVPANIYDLVYLMTINPLAYVRDVVAMITALLALLYSRPI